MSHRLAVDIGGTFVDAIVFNPQTGALRLEKDFTTPDDASRGVLSAIERLDVSLSDVETFVHGTTLGLNTVLERKGAPTGIITNEGFEDIFEMGLQGDFTGLNGVSAVTIPLGVFGSPSGFMLICRSADDRLTADEIDNISAVTSGLSQAIARCQTLSRATD